VAGSRVARFVHHHPDLVVLAGKPRQIRKADRIAFNSAGGLPAASQGA
jgi:hypothetical protein